MVFPKSTYSPLFQMLISHPSFYLTLPKLPLSSLLTDDLMTTERCPTDSQNCPPTCWSNYKAFLTCLRLINHHALVKACFSLRLCMRSNFLHSISLDFSSQKISLKRFSTPPPPLSAWWNFPFQINQFCQHRNMLSPFRKRERKFPLTPLLIQAPIPLLPFTARFSTHTVSHFCPPIPDRFLPLPWSFYFQYKL